MRAVFIHGLESSSRGRKGTWFRKNFPDMLIDDFNGTLGERMIQLGSKLSGMKDLLLVGSSFGGLMAAVYAIEHPDDVAKVVLLAPALNFREFEKSRNLSTGVPAVLYTGEYDVVCPPDSVIPVAEDVFSELVVHRVDDDHLLHKTFPQIDWPRLIR